MKNITCICCPKGCKLNVDECNQYVVTGNACKRGQKYGVQECKSPTRVVTSTVKVKNGKLRRCPVKTSIEIPKGKVLDVAATLKDIVVEAPIVLYQVIVHDVNDTGVNIIATRTIDKI